MILDTTNMYSDDQAITATAASTNLIDHAVVRSLAPGEPVRILIQVTEAFNNLTNLQIDVETDDNTGFSSATVLSSQTIVLANLTVGARAALEFIPKGNERYTRLNYTVTGSAPTTGQITAGLAVDVDDNDFTSASG